ncbi:MAG: hypothetical protein M3P32_07220 [Chloroflexota bacterium]|nr:hypothetical protein [Chloroflexota bacterium]
MVIHRPISSSLRLSLPRPAGDRLSGPLGRRLDDRYHYLRRVLAGGTEPIESVVVGPGGTWALTLRAQAGRYRKRNGHWYHWSDATDSWIPWDAVPITTARLAGRRLEMYLERATLPSAVTACLAPPGGVEIEWDPGQRPGVQVIRDVDALAARITAGGSLAKGQIERIVALLDPRQPLPRLTRATRSAEPRG